MGVQWFVWYFFLFFFLARKFNFFCYSTWSFSDFDWLHLASEQKHFAIFAQICFLSVQKNTSREMQEQTHSPQDERKLLANFFLSRRTFWEKFLERVKLCGFFWIFSKIYLEFERKHFSNFEKSLHMTHPENLVFFRILVYFFHQKSFFRFLDFGQNFVRALSLNNFVANT